MSVTLAPVIWVRVVGRALNTKRDRVRFLVNSGIRFQRVMGGVKGGHQGLLLRKKNPVLR